MTDKPEPTAEHIDADELAAAKQALQDHRGPTFSATRTELGDDGTEYPVAWDVTCRCGLVTQDYETHLLTVIVHAVHAAQAANLPTDVMLTALVERGALSEERDDQQAWNREPNYHARRYVTPWEPTP